MRQVTVTGAVVNKTGITLFFENGETQALAQEDFRTNDIMERIFPNLAKQQPAILNLDEFSIAKKAEELTNGAVKAIGVAGDKVKVGDHTIDADSIKMHIERAAIDGSKGFTRFMEKFAEIKRGHTAQELTKFLDGADLPVTDDGSILGFKILRGDQTEVMVDHHSGRVKQKLGSLVFMPDSKVDDNRRVACSTGLHIANRNYLRGFWYSNSRLCLVKIQPKDVIAVPLNEVSKMRVSAYHIVKVFSKEDGEQIAAHNKAIHDIPTALKMLEEAVGGDHTPIIEKVEVTGNGQIVVTPVDVKVDRARRKQKKAVTVTQTTNKRVDMPKGLKVEPKDVRLLKKLISNKPHLADQEPKYLRKLIKAQRMLDDGKSLRAISDKLKVDRDALSRNLIRKAA